MKSKATHDTVSQLTAGGSTRNIVCLSRRLPSWCRLFYYCIPGLSLCCQAVAQVSTHISKSNPLVLAASQL